MHYVELANQPGCDRELLVKHTNLEIELKTRVTVLEKLEI